MLAWAMHAEPSRLLKSKTILNKEKQYACVLQITWQREMSRLKENQKRYKKNETSGQDRVVHFALGPVTLTS